MQKVEQNFNPELALIGLSATRPRMKTFYMPSSRTKRFHNFNEFEMANCCRQNSKIDSTHAVTLAMRAGNIVVRHFQLESFHLKMTLRVQSFFWLETYPISVINAKSSNASDPKSPFWKVVSKIGGFGVRIHKAYSYKKVCAFKSTGYFCGRDPSGALYACNELRRS